MKNTIGTALLMTAILAGVGCATYQAYSGKRRPRGEVALLSASAANLIVDGELIDTEDVRWIELLPGQHLLEWVYTHSNNFSEKKALSFDAEAGRRYRLGQRFFPQPHPAGPIGEVIEFAVSTALTPITVFFPSDPPTRPPAGEYYSWILDSRSEQVVAGLAPDVPLSHAPITYVPTHRQE